MSSILKWLGRMTAAFVLFCVAGIAVPPAKAAEKFNLVDYVKLWTECRPVTLLVEKLDNHAVNIGLQKDDIETTIQNRLRGAGIYAPVDRQPAPSEVSKIGQLYANVHVVGLAFHVRLQFNRTMQLEFPNKMKVPGLPVDGWKLQIPAGTWWTGVTGTHGGRPEVIQTVVAGQTDRFVSDYLQINRAACQTDKI